METYIYKGKRYTVEVSAGFIRVIGNTEQLCELVPVTSVRNVIEHAGDFDGDRTNYEEIPDSGEKITDFSRESDGVFRWKGASSLWEKVYTLICDPEGFSYNVELSGVGRPGEVRYFSYEDDVEPFVCSSYQFSEYYTPCPATSPEVYLRRPSALEFRSFFELLIPPPYVYSFMTEDEDGRFGLGLTAKVGEYNFIHFDYRTCGRGKKFGFFMSTNLEGHTEVNGKFILPEIRAFFGESDMDVIRKYGAFHYDSGLCRKKDRSNVPRWWRGPIVCGWNEQEVQIKDGYSQNGMATQEVYMKIADMIKDHGIRPTILIIDDKWQRTYGDCMPDPEKWPDMRAFTDEMHSRGIHTLLWFRLWGGEGLPADEVMDGDGMPYNNGRVRLDYRPYADPTNEKYRARLKNIIYKLLSSDEGCMNCDGFKLDYSLVMPYGKCAKSAGGKYGAEMTKTLYSLIYNTAKEVKPDALINGSPCHPYFDEVCDQARLHDYSWALRCEKSLMGERAKLFDAMLPGVLIDTDSVNLSDRHDAMKFYRAMPSIGVPDIYQFSNDWVIKFTDDDWREIEGIFNDYSDKMDRLYGKA